MAAGWIEKITGSLEQKKQYWEYKARVKQLPENYRTAIEALERYLTYFGMIADGDTTPIRAIVGDDPVEFAEAFLQNYSGGQWINKERARLRATIDRAAGKDAS